MANQQQLRETITARIVAALATPLAARPQRRRSGQRREQEFAWWLVNVAHWNSPTSRPSRR